MKANEVLLSEWMKDMKDIWDIAYSVGEEGYEEIMEFNKKFWVLDCEDRNIVLEDLKAEEGILYKKMVAWTTDPLIVKLECGFNMWEYSLEDYFRDEFGSQELGRKLFSDRDINKMMYGEDYNEEDYDWDENGNVKEY